jgi:hypothetical protein
LDEYRMRHAEAIGKHWCLVFVASSLLPLDCLPPSLMQGGVIAPFPSPMPPVAHVECL